MDITVSVLLLIIAVVLFGWAALVAAEVVTFGTYAVLVAAGLASFAASHLPWRG